MLYRPNKQTIIEQTKLTKLEHQLNNIHSLMNDRDMFVLLKLKMVKGKRYFGVEALGTNADSLSYVNSLKKTGESYIG